MNNERENEQGQAEIPEILMIREIVRRYLPDGHTLKNIGLSVGMQEQGEIPRFLILIELERQPLAPERYGWADKMAKVLRQRWPKDDFDFKVKIVFAPEDDKR